MIKTVFDILEQMNKGNFDKLPRKIKIDGELFRKVDNPEQVYLDKDNDDLLSRLRCYYNLQKIIKLPVEEIEEKRWEPEYGEQYYYISDWGTIEYSEWHKRNNWDADDFRYSTRNCFETKEKAQEHLDNIKTYYELKNLADKLNNGEEIDWEDDNQTKFYLYLAYDEGTIQILKNTEWTTKSQGTIYCLDSEFNNKAIEKIGRGRLIKLLIGE